MKLRIIFLNILIFHVQSIIKASLEILNYDPLTFRLTFTQNLTLPSFQILVDTNNLPFRILNNQAFSSIYDIQVTQNYQNFDPENTQAFSLVFNQPLDVGNGQLYLSNYIISPRKADIFIYTETWLVYFMFVLLFICSLFGIIGLSMIDFIQIYILTEMKFRNQTSTIEAYTQLFFFDKSQIQSNPQAYLFKVIRPTVILVGVFLFGTLVKFFAKYIKNHFLKKRIVKFLSYNLFLTVWTIILPSIIYKAFQFIYDFSSNKLSLTNQQQIVGVIFTYLNFLNFMTYFYVLYFVLNPKVKQDPKKFRQYMLSSEFQLYNKFHRGLHLRDWVKRNTFLFLSVRKLLIVILFFLSDNISPWILSLQLVGSFFIFTVRPYKEWFYTNVIIIFNLLWFFFYILVLQGFFYFNISNTLETRSSLTIYLITKTIIFHLISFLGVIAAFFEGFRLFKNLRYQFEEQTQSKQKSNPIFITRGRLYTQNSQRMANQMKQSLIFDNPNSPKEKKKRRIPSNNNIGRSKINLFEVQMEQFSPSISDRKLSTRIKKKWKDLSLLEQLATN